MARSEITEEQICDADFLSEAEALTLSGTLQVQIDAKPDNLLELDDTPDTYSDGLYLKATSSGVEWATASGGGGTSNHSELNELDYALSGHSGFSPTIHTHTESDVTDLDKYTQVEVDTISGSLSSEIDSDISTHEAGDSHDSRYYTETELNNGQLDNRYYTESEVDTISGSLSGEIDDNVSTHSSSGDHDGRYYTETEVNTISGTLQNEIDILTYLNLIDTSTTYSGQAGKLATVNNEEDGLIFEYFEWDAEEAPLIPETAISGTYYVNFEGGRLLIGATGSKPALVYNGPVAGLAFNSSKTESCYGVLKIPYSWNTESNIKATINFMVDIDQIGTNTCSWRLDYHTYTDGELYGDKTTTTINVDTILPINVVAGTYLTKELYMVYNDVNNPVTRGDMVTFKFYRAGAVGADTMKGDSVLFTLVFELQTGQNVVGG